MTSFWLQAGLFAMAAAVSAIGLTLLVGRAGQLSLGHAFFVAIGAYGYCYLAGPSTSEDTHGLGLPPLLALLGAVATAGVAGALFGVSDVAIKYLTHAGRPADGSGALRRATPC